MNKKSTSTYSFLKCPRELVGRKYKSAWKDIVESYVADYFNKGDIALLTNYVRAKVMADELFEKMGDERYVELYEENFKAWKVCCNLMATLSTKLRLSPSSRIRPEDAVQSNRKKHVSKTFQPESDWRSHQKKPHLNG